MRSLFILVGFALLCPERGMSQSIQTSRLATSNLFTVSFSDSMNGWIGGSGVLMRTSDGGETWTTDSLSGPMKTFTCVKAISATFAWLVWFDAGYYPHSYLGRSNNLHGWDTLMSVLYGGNSKPLLTLVDAMDSLRAWVAGSVSFIAGCCPPLRNTTDGGHTWSYASLQPWGYPSVSYTALRLFSDSAVGLLFNEQILYRTDNAGRTWSSDTFSRNYYDLAIPRRNDFWLVGDAGSVIRSTDSGATWVAQPTPTSRALGSIYALDSVNAWAVGTKGTVIRTSDGGRRWDSVGVPSNQRLNAVSFSDKRHGWIVGDSGVLVRIRYIPTSVPESVSSKPMLFALQQNYPNPFNPSTRITFSLPSTLHCSLRIFNLLGQQVATLVDVEKEAGRYSLEWNASNVPTGVYFCRLEAGGFVQTKKLALIR